MKKMRTMRIMRNTQALFLTAIMAVSAALTLSAAGCSCASKAETVDAELSEAETTATASDVAEAEETETETTDIEEIESTDTEETSVEAEDTTEETETEGTTTAEEEAGTEKTTAEATTASGYTYASMDKTMYVKKQVNVRSLPATDGTKLGSLSAGTAVTVTGQCNETSWYRIEYDGGVGYVSNNYLTSTKLSETTTTGKASEATTKESETTKTYSSLLERYLDQKNVSGFTDSEIKALCEEMAAEVVNLVNQERTAIGLWAYETDETLTKAAQIRAEEQATSFGHIRPDGSQCDTVILEVGLSYISASENAAMGQRTPEEVMEDWMNSAAHKGNILSGNYGDYSTDVSGLDGKTYEYKTTHIGVGCYYDKKTGTFYWIQIFTQLHTHTWTEDTVIVIDSEPGTTTITGTHEAYCCTDPYCSAEKDLDGTVHEHEEDGYMGSDGVYHYY